MEIGMSMMIAIGMEKPMLFYTLIAIPSWRQKRYIFLYGTEFCEREREKM